MSGWIKLHRSLLEWEWYDDKNALVLLIHLLVSVNYEDKKWRGRIIKAGSMAYSWDKLSESCGLSNQQCRTAMRKLESSGEVDRISTNKYQIVTLVKWDKLQVFDVNDNNQITSNQQSNNNQITTTKESKEYKERKEVKKKETLLVSSIPDGMTLNENQFIAKSFWELFKSNLLETGITKTTNLDKAKLNDWEKDIRLMIEKDCRTKEELQTVYKFLQKDVFWKKNIQSTKKLREQFERLFQEAQTKQNVTNDRNDEMNDYGKELEQRLKNLANGGNS